MTDKELLELAAKAAGIEGSMRPDGIKISSGRYWNPLTDDGDALRVAVSLGLNVYPIARTAAGQACSAVGTGSHGRLSEVIDCDPYAATRRAIVRAAAEIGRTK